MERDKPYLDMSGHPPNPNQSAPRSGQNILGAPYIAQPSSTGIQCLDTDTAPSLDPALIGLQDLQINQYGNGVQSASGFSDAHMNVPYAGHPRPVGNSTTDYRIPSNGPMVRGESATPNEDRPGNGHHIPITEPPDAKSILEGMLHSRNDSTRIVRRYESTIRLLHDNNIAYEQMLQVVSQTGLSCLLSRSNFFRILDNDALNSELSYGCSPPASLPDQYSTAQDTISSLSPRVSSTGGLKFPKYEDKKVRFGSYYDWKGKHHTPKQLCDNGFFYTGEHDKCKCFYCGVMIYKWEAGDDPVDEHYKHSDQCPLAKQKMDEKNSASLLVADQTQGHTICQVCRIYQIGVSQFYCGHIVCKRCAPLAGENKVCKMCGEEVVRTSAYDKHAL